MDVLMKHDGCAQNEECADRNESLASLCECFYEVNKHRTQLKGWLMPPIKFSSKKLKKENYIPIILHLPTKIYQ